MPRLVARVSLPTAAGTFDARAFECASGYVYLCLSCGEVADAPSVLARLHSECLTGDAFGSLRCDCGVQLRWALKTIAAEGRGVLVYATGHEGRGIGLVEKLRAYIEQENGADTVDANLRLGHPVDARDYGDAAAVLQALGVRSVRLLTNNPSKVEGLRAAGVLVDSTRALPTAPHVRNREYLRTKEARLGHLSPAGEALNCDDAAVADVTELLGEIRPRPTRPYVTLKFAQTVDGRIATATGDAKWISGEAERRISHALRAACDAVLVGVGTVLCDDPQLTVRMVPGASPVRVVLDSTLRIPLSAKILAAEAPTLVMTTEKADRAKHRQLQDLGVGVRVMPSGAGGVDLGVAFAALRAEGMTCLLVEGGARVITSILAAEVADRLIVGMAPIIIGAGTDAVGELGISRIADGLRLSNRSVHIMDDDILVGWDLEAGTGPVEHGPARRR